MKVVIFCHSLVSDWNHGNAHFLRGIAAELLDRGHDVHVLEPAGAWSRTNLVDAYGAAPEEEFASAFAQLASTPSYALRSKRDISSGRVAAR